MTALQPKELLENFDATHFTFLCLIGRGSFGEVHKCIHIASGLTLAIKIIDLEKAEDEIDDIRKEISFHGQCEHPNITTYYNSRVVGSKLWILMEFLGGGSAIDLLQLGVMEEVYIATIVREMLKGLAYLHDQNKIHRDIKCANILLSDTGDVKLADFGVAGQLTDTLQGRSTFVGTPFWMAPEVIKQSKYDSKADIWSVGITVYELAHGHPPHHDLHPMKALFAICKEHPPELGEDYSRNMREFCVSCLNKDPNNRQTARNLLKHKFLKIAKRPSILTDLIEKMRMQESTGRPVPVIALEENEKKCSVESPDWEFGTVKVLDSFETPDVPLPVYLQPESSTDFSNKRKSAHAKSSSYSIIERKPSSLGSCKSTEVQNLSLPENDCIKSRSPSVLCKNLAYTPLDDVDDKSKLKGSSSKSKRAIASNFSKKDVAQSEEHRIFQAVTAFNGIVEKVAADNDVDLNVVSEFMANLSVKTKELAEFYSTILKLANDAKRFNSNVKK